MTHSALTYIMIAVSIFVVSGIALFIYEVLNAPTEEELYKAKDNGEEINQTD